MNLILIRRSGHLWKRTLAFLERPGFVFTTLFIVSLVCLSPFFHPSFGQISDFDEAIYINSGRRLTHGEWIPFKDNPLVAVFYAAIAWPIRDDPFWLLRAAGIGRLVLFCAHWLNTYALAKRLRSVVPPPLVAAGLAASPVLSALLLNSSDALFALFSGAAFLQILLFHHRRDGRHVWLASALTGCAAMSRSDGLFLEAALVILSLVGVRMARARPGAAHRPSVGAALAASLVPFIVIVVGYNLVRGARTGDFSLGTQERAYLAFQQGQGVVFQVQRHYINPYYQGMAESDRLFGSAALNHNSVFRAILRNPRAFSARVIETARQWPGQLLAAYGGVLAWFLLPACLLGLVGLIRRRMFLLLCLFLLWPAHLLVYFAFFFREGYLLLPYFEVFLLAAWGVRFGLGVLERHSSPILWLGLGALAGAVALRQLLHHHHAKALVLVCAALFGAARALYPPVRHSPLVRPGVLAAALGLLLVFRMPKLSPARIRIAATPSGEAVLFLRAHGVADTRIASYAPLDPFEVRCTYVPMWAGMEGLRTDQDFSAWVTREKVSVIWIDPNLRILNPYLCRLAERQDHRGFHLAFSSPDRSNEILLSDATLMGRLR